MRQWHGARPHYARDYDKRSGVAVPCTGSYLSREARFTTLVYHGRNLVIRASAARLLL